MHGSSLIVCWGYGIWQWPGWEGWVGDVSKLTRALGIDSGGGGQHCSLSFHSTNQVSCSQKELPNLYSLSSFKLTPLLRIDNKQMTLEEILMPGCYSEWCLAAEGTVWWQSAWRSYDWRGQRELYNHPDLHLFHVAENDMCDTTRMSIIQLTRVAGYRFDVEAKGVLCIITSLKKHRTTESRMYSGGCNTRYYGMLDHLQRLCGNAHMGNDRQDIQASFYSTSVVIQGVDEDQGAWIAYDFTRALSAIWGRFYTSSNNDYRTRSCGWHPTHILITILFIGKWKGGYNSAAEK